MDSPQVTPARAPPPERLRSCRQPRLATNRRVPPSQTGFTIARGPAKETENTIVAAGKPFRKKGRENLQNHSSLTADNF